jgi:hypothetical protein
MEAVFYSIVTCLFIIFMTGVFLSWFFMHKAKSRERLLMIEKGVDLSQLHQQRKYIFNFPWLKVGIVVASMGFGMVVGGFSHNPFIIFGAIFLFGGIGMIVANYLDKPKGRE